MVNKAHAVPPWDGVVAAVNRLSPKLTICDMVLSTSAGAFPVLVYLQDLDGLDERILAACEHRAFGSFSSNFYYLSTRYGFASATADRFACEFSTEFPHLMPKKLAKRPTPTDTEPESSSEEPKAMDADVFRRALVLLAPKVPLHVRLFMMLTKATRAEFWAPPGVAMEITADSRVNATGRRGAGEVVAKLMQRWEPMRVGVTLNCKAIELFALVASEMQLLCITSVSIHADTWPHSIDAFRLLWHLSKVQDSPLQHLRVHLGTKTANRYDVSEYPETTAVFSKLETLSFTAKNWILLCSFTRLQFSPALRSLTCKAADIQHIEWSTCQQLQRFRVDRGVLSNDYDRVFFSIPKTLQHLEFGVLCRKNELLQHVFWWLQHFTELRTLRMVNGSDIGPSWDGVAAAANTLSPKLAICDIVLSTRYNNPAVKVHLQDLDGLDEHIRRACDAARA
eukprot:1951781-Rhodomonas_salina.2